MEKENAWVDRARCSVCDPRLRAGGLWRQANPGSVPNEYPCTTSNDGADEGTTDESPADRSAANGNLSSNGDPGDEL